MQSRGSLAAVILVGIVIVLTVIRFAAPTFWNMLTAPLWRSGAFISTQVAGQVTTESKASLRTERDAVQAENAVLTVQNAALTAQLADLTKLLGGRTEPVAGIVARVLARPPAAPYDVLILDQGTTAGVALGALVTGNGGTPLGTIGQVDSTQSRVALYSTRNIQSSGWAGEGHIPLTLTGEGAGAFSATVPKVAGVKIGDGVYLSNTNGFPIGTIVSIEEDPSSPSVSLDVRPYANPFSVTVVTVERR